MDISTLSLLLMLDESSHRKNLFKNRLIIWDWYSWTRKNPQKTWIKIQLTDHTEMARRQERNLVRVSSTHKFHKIWPCTINRRQIYQRISRDFWDDFSFLALLLTCQATVFFQVFRLSNSTHDLEDFVQFWTLLRFHINLAFSYQVICLICPSLAPLGQLKNHRILFPSLAKRSIKFQMMIS